MTATTVINLSDLGRNWVDGEVCFSDPARLDLCIYRGDTGVLRVTVTWSDGTPINLAGASWDADIRATADSPDVITTLGVVPVPGVANQVDVIISAAASAGLPVPSPAQGRPPPVWDLELTLDGQVQTLLRGNVLVTADVSRNP